MSKAILPAGTKKCRRCKKTKTHAEFAKRKRMKDGRETYCKLCECRRVQKWKKRAIASGRKAPIQRTHKRCTKCGTVKPIDRFSIHTPYKGDGRNSCCKRCKVAIMMARYWAEMMAN